jgi:FMN phosphatase YigB (HAD superfamily)
LQLSGVKASEACHIGDEPVADIEGAMQVGVDAILIDRTDRFDSFAGLKIRSFLELG